MISNKDKIIRIGSYISVYLIIFLGMHFFIGRKINKAIHSEKVKSKENEDKLKKQRNLIISMPNYEKQLRGIKNKEKEFNEKKFDEKELYFNSQLILTQKSSGLGINIRSIKSVEEMSLEFNNVQEGISKAYIEIILKTKFLTLGKFFESLRDLPITLAVEKVRIEKINDSEENLSKGKEKDEVNATIIFSSYAIIK